MLEVSQYTYAENGGVSACTVIAAEVMRYILTIFAGGRVDWSPEELTNQIQLGVQRYKNLNGGIPTHLSVDELGPGFFGDIANISFFQGLLNDNSAFQRMITEAVQNSSKQGAPVGIIITKPPETIAIVIAPQINKFYFFDSHSRPEKGLHGSYLVEADNIESISRWFKSTFVPLSNDILGNDMMNQMYNMFEGYGYQAS